MTSLWDLYNVIFLEGRKGVKEEGRQGGREEKGREEVKVGTDEGEGLT